MDILITLIKEARDELKREIKKEKAGRAKVTDEVIAASCDEMDINAHTRKSFYVGYLRGVAEAQDMTITQLLESL